jgi:hypothetical protein
MSPYPREGDEEFVGVRRVGFIVDAFAETPLFAKNQIFYAMISGR